MCYGSSCKLTDWGEPSGKTVIKSLDITIHEATPQPKMQVRVQEIHKATREEQKLQLLIQQPTEGWP